MTLKPAHLLAALIVSASLPAMAQNLAVVNGKPIPSSRADVMIKQMTSQGQQDTPEPVSYTQLTLPTNREV